MSEAAWKVSTPIDTFANPETGSQIDVVSMVHVGQPIYYQKLGRYIMGRQDEGFTVHYERIAASDEATETIGPLTWIKSRIREAELDQSARAYALVEIHSSYTIQDDTELFREAGSENHDVTDAYVARHTSLLTGLRAFGNERRLRHKLKKDAHKGPEAMDEVVFGGIKANVDKYKSGKTHNKRRDKVTIHARNQAALEGVDATLQDDPEARLVLVWGLGHLAGLRSGLLDRGYEHAGRQEVELAVNYSQLKRDIQKYEADLRRQQAKVDRQRRTAGHSTGRPYKGTKPVLENSGRSSLIDPDVRRTQAFAQFEKDQLRRQKETQKWLDERMQQSEKDRKRRESKLSYGGSN